MINFGTVTVGSDNVKNFGVINDLQQTVLVELKLPEGLVDLAATSPLAQVIPPGATAGFDIRFRPEVVEEFGVTVGYSINKRHNFAFQARARVVPVELEMSPREIHFRFPEFSADPDIS